jgi:hypothetical protein
VQALTTGVNAQFLFFCKISALTVTIQSDQYMRGPDDVLFGFRTTFGGEEDILLLILCSRDNTKAKPNSYTHASHVTMKAVVSVFTSPKKEMGKVTKSER